MREYTEVQELECGEIRRYDEWLDAAQELGYGTVVEALVGEYEASFRREVGECVRGYRYVAARFVGAGHSEALYTLVGRYLRKFAPGVVRGRGGAHNVRGGVVKHRYGDRSLKAVCREIVGEGGSEREVETLYMRILVRVKSGWSIERAVSEPVVLPGDRNRGKGYRQRRRLARKLRGGVEG